RLCSPSPSAPPTTPSIALVQIASTTNPSVDPSVSLAQIGSATPHPSRRHDKARAPVLQPRRVDGCEGLVLHHPRGDAIDAFAGVSGNNTQFAP
ncbi:hypothetical protein E2562_033726, partial [Oryza meyeriana var. granulata]